MWVRAGLIALLAAAAVASLVIRVWRDDARSSRSTPDFVAEQQRVGQHLTPAEVRRVGPISEIARGPMWSFMAWRAVRGICIAYASGEVTNWASGCGDPLPRMAPDSGAPRYLITLLVAPIEHYKDSMHQGAVGGAVSPQVH